MRPYVGLYKDDLGSYRAPDVWRATPRSSCVREFIGDLVIHSNVDRGGVLDRKARAPAERNRQYEINPPCGFAAITCELT